MYKETEGNSTPNENDSHSHLGKNNSFIFTFALEISRNAHIYI
jgi:hypothetical protein